MLNQNKQGLIIGLCGRLCCGKSEIAQILQEQYGGSCKHILINETFHVKQFIDELLNIMENEFHQKNIDSYSPEELNKLEQLIKQTHQKHLFPEASFKKLAETLQYNEQHQIVYPLTVQNEFDLLYQRNYFHLIAIQTPTQKRYDNFLKKYSHKITLQLFTIIDDIISEQVQQFMYKARIQLNNSGDQKDIVIESYKKFQDIFRPIRPNWHQYFMHIAHIVKTRSNCMKRAVGCLIVKNDRIVATGYNGTPFGIKNCWENGCQRCNSNTRQGVDLEKCFCFHAEESAILEIGTSKSKNMVMYTTLFPCLQCTKIILATKIQQIYYEEDFANSAATSELHKYLKVERIDTSHYVY